MNLATELVVIVAARRDRSTAPSRNLRNERSGCAREAYHDIYARIASARAIAYAFGLEMHLMLKCNNPHAISPTVLVFSNFERV